MIILGSGIILNTRTEFSPELIRIVVRRQGCAPADISDADMAANFFHAALSGEVHDYLTNAQIAVCIGNTLFIHGAADGDNMGFLPTDNQDALQEVTLNPKL